MSFDVNTVRTDTRAYSAKKSFFWLPPARRSAKVASRRKKPSSSRYTDKTVRLTNRARILSGFMSPDAVRPAHASLAPSVPERSKISPPATGGIQ